MTQKAAIALLRVSTDAQDVARQRADITRLKNRFGLHVLRDLELIGLSGTATLDDAQVRQVLADLKKPGVGGLAVSSLDRLFRPGKRFGQFAILDHFLDEHKIIWSQREGEIDPNTDEGYDKCISAGGRAGQEWRDLRRRTWDGKEVLRREGRSANGPNTIPRGVAYGKATGKWSYVEPDCLEVARMFPLFLAGDSYHTLEDKFPGWSFEGIRRTLRNVIWIGLRKFPARGRREEAYTVRVIDEQLVSDDIFWAAQREADRRKTEWRKTYGRRHGTLSSLLRCSCGAKCYVRYSGQPSKKNYYYCSSAARGHGPKCGARGWQMEGVDAGVDRLVSENLCQAPVLRTILSDIAAREPDLKDARVKAEREIKDLEAKRARIVEMRADGRITREECGKRLDAVDQKLQSARGAAAQVPTPAIDMQTLACGLAVAFAGFSSLPREQRLDLLRRAVRDIVLDGTAIPSITLRGGFLGEILASNTMVANSSTHS